ncbi:hypothetical protein FA95DRAFT_1607059 [Auriscalpium vulgare]|uniref:Uncharacterized protein n=1 Tax=Auriscalpium vulgare TaxID=40419 RepID=A0ACB8RRI5_9AGAM|nr:hypothetical protein FA95DRAFT_1607059 [Auriscalpium vulgare]
MQFSTFSMFSIIAAFLSIQAAAAPTLDSRAVLASRCGGGWFKRCLVEAVTEDPEAEGSETT